MFPFFFSQNRFRFVFSLFLCALVSITIIAQDSNIEVSDLFPQDVICYFEMKDIQDLWKTAKNKALSNLSAEDAKKVDDETTRIFKQFTEAIKKEVGFDIEKTFSAVDSFYLSLNNLSFNVDKTETITTIVDSSFDMELLLGLKSISEGFFDSILKNELKDAFKVISSSRNTTLYELPIKDSTLAAFQSIFVVTFDKFAFASNKRMACETVEAKFIGNDKSVSLKENRIYKKILSETSSKSVIQLGWIDATQVWNVLEKNINRQGYKIYQQIEAVIEFKALNDITFYSTLDNDILISTIKCDITKNGSEVYDLIRQNPAIVDVLNIIPDKCLLLFELRISNTKQLWTKLKKFISEKEQDLTEEERQHGTFNEGIEEFESKLGMLIEDLVEPFGDEFAFAICGDSFEHAEENMLFITEISNMEKFEMVENKILTESEWNKDELPTASDYKDFNIKSTRVEGNFFYTVVDKFLLISPTDNAIKEVIDNYLNKKTLKNSEDLKYAVYGLPEKVSKFLYFNGSELTKISIQGISRNTTKEKMEELFEKLKFKNIIALAVIEKETEVIVSSSSRVEDFFKSACIMLGIMYPAFQEAYQKSLTYNCSNNMRDLTFQISYTRTLKRKFPTDLSEVEISPQTPNLKKETLIQCPASKENFTYIYPADEDRTPQNYILIFETVPHLENFNVIYFDGTYSQLTKEVLIQQLKTQLEKQKTTLQKLIDKEKDTVKKKAYEDVKSVYESVKDFIKK